MLLTVSELMSLLCVVLLCSGVQYVVIVSDKQLLHVVLFWCCRPLYHATSIINPRYNKYGTLQKSLHCAELQRPICYICHLGQ